MCLRLAVGVRESAECGARRLGLPVLCLRLHVVAQADLGGAAGAAPVLIGWSAVTDSLAWPPVLLFAVIFFWTPPHFWALAIRYEEDYTAADVPMLPSVVSRHETAVRILVYTIVVWALSLAFVPVGEMGWIRRYGPRPTGPLGALRPPVPGPSATPGIRWMGFDRGSGHV